MRGSITRKKRGFPVVRPSKDVCNRTSLYAGYLSVRLSPPQAFLHIPLQRSIKSFEGGDRRGTISLVNNAVADLEIFNPHVQVYFFATLFPWQEISPRKKWCLLARRARSASCNIISRCSFVFPQRGYSLFQWLFAVPPCFALYCCQSADTLNTSGY